MTHFVSRSAVAYLKYTPEEIKPTEACSLALSNEQVTKTPSGSIEVYLMLLNDKQFGT